MNEKKQGLQLILSYVLIQFAVIVYSLAGVTGKLASANAFLSVPFILFYCLEIACLGAYAIMWQQIVKRHELSVAYVNRSLSLLWSMLWSMLFFRERITSRNLIGAAVVIAGVILVNTAEEGVNQ